MVTEQAHRRPVQTETSAISSPQPKALVRPRAVNAVPAWGFLSEPRAGVTEGDRAHRRDPCEEADGRC